MRIRIRTELAHNTPEYIIKHEERVQNYIRYYEWASKKLNGKEGIINCLVADKILKGQSYEV